MRPRIKNYPKLVASTSKDATIQELCAFNRKQAHKTYNPKKSYILNIFGVKKKISAKEAEYYRKQGFNIKVIEA